MKNLKNMEKHFYTFIKKNIKMFYIYDMHYFTSQAPFIANELD